MTDLEMLNDVGLLFSLDLVTKFYQSHPKHRIKYTS